MTRMSRICGRALGLIMLLGIVGSIAADISSGSAPKVEDVLEHVLDRARVEGRNDREFKKRYAYTRSRITEQRTSKGKLKEREVKRSENNPKPPMTPASQIVSAAEERQDAPSAAKELQQDPNGEVRGRAFEKNDFPLNADLLKRFQFTLAGREVVDGLPARSLITMRRARMSGRLGNRARFRSWDQGAFEEGSRRRKEADFGSKSSPPRYLGGYVGLCDS